MEKAYEPRSDDPTQDARWHAKHGFEKDAEGRFTVESFEAKDPVTTEDLLKQIEINSAGGYEALEFQPYDDRIFTMVCGGPSLEKHLDEIRRRVKESDKYLVACSNMTAAYLLSHGIVPHVHFIIDPKEKKYRDVLAAMPEEEFLDDPEERRIQAMVNFINDVPRMSPLDRDIPNGFHPDVEYWINAGCHPKVFETLVKQGAKPKIFLAEFEGEGVAQAAMYEGMSKSPDFKGFLGIQGGTMAGLRAINLADARGHREVHYFGFDGSVEVFEKGARAYAYKKPRGEAIIEVECDRCKEKFPSTLILQGQVNEFLKWHSYMPWIKVKIYGGGLIDHYFQHVLADKKPKATHRFTQEYLELQRQMHADHNYGVSGIDHMPTIFHGISQLARRHGKVSVLDYGSSTGRTFEALREMFWLPPTVDFRLYDPAIEGLDKEPEPADFVICTDVLEHVEPECTWAVLDHLQSLAKRLIFVSISLKPAVKYLKDGRNAHINLRDVEFWLKEFKKRFIVSEATHSEKRYELLIVAQSIESVRRSLSEVRQARTVIERGVSHASVDQEGEGRVPGEHTTRDQSEENEPAQRKEAKAAA